MMQTCLKTFSRVAASLTRTVCVDRLFGAVDDIFCMFQGTIENVAVLKQQYGLSKGANEVNIIIEAYRTLRDGSLSS